MKIVLLGANGFVGRSVGKILTENKVTFLSLSKTKRVDLKNLSETSEALNEIKPDIIINCAAHVGSLNYVTQQAATIIIDNSRMIMSMYEAIAKICPDCIVINPVANCAYPAIDEKFEEDDIWKGPVHASVYAYGGAKRFLLMIAKSFEMQYGIKSIQLLVPNMYGPYDSTDPNKAHALNALISRFVKAESIKTSDITLWGTGIAIREWLFAEDFGKIVLSIIQNPLMLGLSEPLNIAQNFGLSVKELVLLIQQHFINKFTIKWDATMPDGAPKKVMDDTKFKKVFPTFQFTGFNNGIGQTINYYKSVYPY
ncbi:MAG: NAD-dependent epimerase/dehydratase family protein [Ginsengibacter sp.]